MHDYLVPALAFVFGLVIGSFANVFILRWGTGRSLNGRSGCSSCGTMLSWRELVPVASFILQRGRCRFCDGRISPQYPIVELLFGVLFAVSAYVAMVTFGTGMPLPLMHGGFLVHMLFGWVFVFLLISIAVYDLRHFIIPDGMVYAFIAISFVWGIMREGATVSGSLSVIGAGLLTALPLFLLWAFSKGRWMGFGDVKLAIGMGMMLGALGGISALIFGVWGGALVSLSVIALSRIVRRMRIARFRGQLTMKSEIPFGPFLVFGTLFVFFTEITLVRLVGMF